MNPPIVFADTNVLLEVILPNRPSIEAARDCLGVNSIVISPLTAHLVAYFGTKAKLELPYVLELVSQFEFTDFNAATVRWAIQNRQDQDFEDALQVACAVLSRSQKIATFDQRLAKNYQKFIPIEVLA